MLVTNCFHAGQFSLYLRQTYGCPYSMLSRFCTVILAVIPHESHYQYYCTYTLSNTFVLQCLLFLMLSYDNDVCFVTLVPSCPFVLNCDRSTVKHTLPITQNDCYQWLCNSSRVHQIRFRPGLRPGPRWGSLQRSPRPPSWFKGPYL